MAAVAIAGTLMMRVDGQQYRMGGKFAIYPGPIERTGVAGLDGPVGFTQKFVIPRFDADIYDSGGLSLMQIQAITDSNITVQLVNGKNYVLTDAWYSGEEELNAVDGKISAKFEGITMTEILA